VRRFTPSLIAASCDHLANLLDRARNQHRDDMHCEEGNCGPSHDKMDRTGALPPTKHIYQPGCCWLYAGADRKA